MPLVLLSTNGHYQDRVVEMTQEEIDYARKIEGERYLFDTEEGRALIKELKAKPNKLDDEIVIYC